MILYFRTGVKTKAKPGKTRFYMLEQEIVERSEVHEAFECEPFVEEDSDDKDKKGHFLMSAISEDDCLYHNLVQQFVEEFDCLHAR